VFATRVKNGQYHQVRVRKEPLFGFGSRGFSGACKGSKVAVAREAPKVVQADPGEVCDFVFREELLARPNSDHLRAPQLL
jgi:hypothetical protein